MKKLIYITFGLLVTCTSNLYAQNLASFLEESWEVEAYYAQYAAENRISFYHKDSTNNTETWDGITYDFIENGTFNIVIEDTINRTADWEIYSNGDSLLLSGIPYKLVTLTETDLIIRQSGFSFNVPLDYYFVLKPKRIVNTKEKFTTSAITVFPIPCKDELTLHFSASSPTPTKVAIQTLEGNKVNNFTLNGQRQQTISLYNYTSGMYLLKVYGNDNELIDVKKIVIEN